MDQWRSELIRIIIIVTLATICFVNGYASKGVDDNMGLPFCVDPIKQTTREAGPRGTAQEDRSPDGRSVILVSTMDGRISALNAADGSILWSHLTKPGNLLSSALGNLEFVSERKSVRLVPSLDGDLYTFDGEQMGAIPLSMDALMSNSMKVGEDTVVTGGKEIRTYGINRTTGQIKYVCGMEGCDHFAETVDVENREEDVIVVRRLTRTVRAISSKTGMEKWNYSVGQHEVSLASDPMNSGCHGSKIVSERSDIRFIVSEGIVLALDGTDPLNKQRWKQELKVPIVHAWQLRDQEMEDLDLFEESNEPDSNTDGSNVDLRPILHVGTYNKQLYILQSRRFRGALQLEWDTFGIPGHTAFPKITWRPYLISAHSRTPILLSSYPPSHLDLIGHREKSTALVPRVHDADYPYDSGFTLYTNTFLLEGPDDGLDPIRFTNVTVDDEKEEEETLDQIIMVSLWYWWKEVLGISITFAVFVNICITRHVVRRMKQKFLKESSQEIAAIEQKVPFTNVEPARESESHNSTDSQLSMSTPPTEFVSRYVSDFEPIQKLGKGGFGVVFQARNKIDDCEYAIKRICMPNRDDSRARIMREVKALAKLDHVSIVRYYNAWLECPPSDWQDGCFNTTEDVFTPSSSMTYEELQIMYRRRDQNGAVNKGNCRPTNENNLRKDTSFSLTVPLSTKSSNTSASGSFIVFENSDGRDVDVASSVDDKVKHSIRNTVQSPDDSESIQFLNSGKGDELGGTEEERKSTEKIGMGDAKCPFVFEEPDKLYLYIQMQLCQKDSLKDWLNNETENRDKFEVLDFFYQIVSAVEYIHEQGLIHRDLKPSNIFFAQDGSIKVGDFGLAATTTTNSDVRPSGFEGRVGDSMAFSASRHTNQVGTMLYMSPEQIAEEVYDHKVDIFSLGLIFFEMLVPFCTAMERVKVMTDARNLTFPSNFVSYYPDELSLVKELLSRRAEDRPLASNVKQHPLLQDFQPRPELLRRNRKIRIASRTYSTSSSGSGSGLGITVD